MSQGVGGLGEAGREGVSVVVVWSSLVSLLGVRCVNLGSMRKLGWLGSMMSSGRWLHEMGEELALLSKV